MVDAGVDLFRPLRPGAATADVADDDDAATVLVDAKVIISVPTAVASIRELAAVLGVILRDVTLYPMVAGGTSAIGTVTSTSERWGSARVVGDGFTSLAFEGSTLRLLYAAALLRCTAAGVAETIASSYFNALFLTGPCNGCRRGPADGGHRWLEVHRDLAGGLHPFLIHSTDVLSTVRCASSLQSPSRVQRRVP